MDGHEWMSESKLWFTKIVPLFYKNNTKNFYMHLQYVFEI